MPSISSLESSDFGEYSSFCILNLSFRPGVALTAWPGFSYFGPRIAFHATSFMITETRHGLAVHISGYSDETGKSRVRTKPTSRQHQEAEVDLRVFDSSAHRCKSRMGVLRVNGDRQVFCQGESVRQDLPRGQLPIWVPLYMCGLEQVARFATRQCLGEEPRRCRSIYARDAHRRCPPTEARTRAAPNS